MMKPRSPLILVGLILAAFAAGGIGGWATASSVTTWYPTLMKPSWNPPSGVFGPVWTTLYVMMAIAAWRVVGRGFTFHPAARAVAIGYFVQLVLNASWSVLFFGLHRPDLAFAEILVLWCALLWMQVRFIRVDRVAAILWAPYLAWVSFAALLNFTIWRLNP